MIEYALYFIMGGTIVSLVIWLARQGHTLLSGIALVFPSVTLVSMYFIGRAAGNNAVATTARSAIYSTFFVWIPYISTVAFLAPRLGVNRALVAGFLVFLVLALGWIYFNYTKGSL